MNVAERLQAPDALGWHAEEERRRPHMPAKPAAPPPSASPETGAERVQATRAASEHGGDERGRPHIAASPVAAPSVSPELVRRFQALIDEVTDELMQGQQLDRRTCRADAIALLVATNGLLDESPPQHDDSPLMYLLLEEQQKAASVLGRAQPVGSLLTFMKA